MRRARGYLLEVLPEKTTERETFTCAHCGKIVILPPPDAAQQAKNRVRDVRRCFCCDAFTCPECARVAKCVPFEKRVEAYERRMRLRALM